MSWFESRSDNKFIIGSCF
ncbi:hypothetical protein GJU39_02730 [Pedobacter petrophilus]|uniref:DNA polymerase B exonuclease N-terminal domain-containing protein n=1 Tax=Pedobacter petrophilus TaxID=1908241 RepID=A0A7K0FUJ0_9SPHI|nr:hypothetical protein [Pedobacter petrophilus]NTD96798.1 hypothetical protein [Agrobacterium tumefaciens]NTE18777.1 hypothetical protein [Agrobacterium tumefaciens]